MESYSKIESSDDDSNKKPAQKMKPAKVVRAKTVAQVEAPSDVQPRRRRSNSCMLIVANYVANYVASGA